MFDCVPKKHNGFFMPSRKVRSSWCRTSSMLAIDRMGPMYSLNLVVGLCLWHHCLGVCSIMFSICFPRSVAGPVEWICLCSLPSKPQYLHFFSYCSPPTMDLHHSFSLDHRLLFHWWLAIPFPKHLMCPQYPWLVCLVHLSVVARRARCILQWLGKELSSNQDDLSSLVWSDSIMWSNLARLWTLDKPPFCFLTITC